MCVSVCLSFFWVICMLLGWDCGCRMGGFRYLCRVGDSGCPTTTTSTTSTTTTTSSSTNNNNTTTTTTTTPSKAATTQEQMADMVRGTFTEAGGTLYSKRTGVSLVVPPGALPPASQQEIYFKVCPAHSGENTALLGPGYQPDEGGGL